MKHDSFGDGVHSYFDSKKLLKHFKLIAHKKMSLQKEMSEDAKGRKGYKVLSECLCFHQSIKTNCPYRQL